MEKDRCAEDRLYNDCNLGAVICDFGAFYHASARNDEGISSSAREAESKAMLAQGNELTSREDQSCGGQDHSDPLAVPQQAFKDDGESCEAGEDGRHH